MPGFNNHSDNASNSLNGSDQEFLRLQRNADNMAVGMVVTWLAVLVISLIELA